MEDSFGEYRFLLLKRKKATFQENFKHLWLTYTTEKKLAISVFIVVLLGFAVVLINVLHGSSSNSSLYSSQMHLNENGPLLLAFQDVSDRKVFLEEYEKGSETVLNLNKLLRVLQRERDLPDGHKSKLQGSRNLEESEILSMCSIVLEQLKRILNKCVDIDILPEECERVIRKPINCSPLSPYRTINGSCNNLDHPQWGMHRAPYKRWLEAAYSDNVSLTRQSVQGIDLPNARYLSSTLFSNKTLPDSNITMFFTHFGLFLDHDMVRTGQVRENLNNCCEKGFHHPACMQMDIDSSDYFYGPMNVSCLGFLRNTPTVGRCPGRREQLNLMTSYIDASDVYGPSDEECASLRAFKDGKLSTLTVNNSVLMPVKETARNACFTSHTTHKCFAAGDIRTNMLLPLMTLHLIWVREHNRIANELQTLNPTWDDETLFQEARRILIAELQCVTYREFLPIIFGQEKMKKYGLHIDENEVYRGYNKNEDATLRNAFSTAAFRFGHTLVQNRLYLIDEDYKIQRNLPLHETFMNPNELYDGNIDSVIRGMTSQNAQQSERYTTEEIRGRLLQRYYQTHGLDLTAISIQRGRDHGLPSYLHWRKFCNLPIAKSWEDLKDFMREEYVEDLKNAYKSVEDIDLLPGALGEKHDSLIGPTYMCLLRKQFLSLRTGDRFWFENPNQSGSFSRDQLKEIYKSSLARFLCNTSDKLSKIQKFPFLKPSEENPLVRCEDLPEMDLSLWKE